MAKSDASFSSFVKDSVLIGRCFSISVSSSDPGMEASA